MSDYIKREDAYEVLTNLYHHQTETQHRALREALNVVPYTDAEPVIRCKDCKHRPHKDERGNVVPPEEDEELSLCPCVEDNDWYYNYIPKDDWYCANGEPKETDNE